MPKGTVDSLSKAYSDAQKARVEVTRQRISKSINLVSDGRVIPDQLDLAIGSGRRLAAVVMFLDISGFSQRSIESFDEQEKTLRALSFFFTEMIRVVEDYGGVVEKNTGDGLMAYFTRDSNWHQDVRHRAVACALTMFHGANQFINPSIVNSNIQRIDFRICIDYGDITIARVGAAQRFNNIVAIGNTANRTAKMLAKAEKNEILLGENMLKGLPQNILSHTFLKTNNSGWKYINSGETYAFWKLDAYWIPYA